jgi:hypothetical protein
MRNFRHSKFTPAIQVRNEDSRQRMKHNLSFDERDL